MFPTHEYLGVWIDDKLSFDVHIKSHFSVIIAFLFPDPIVPWMPTFHNKCKVSYSSLNSLRVCGLDIIDLTDKIIGIFIPAALGSLLCLSLSQ